MSGPLKVLLVEDAPDDAELILYALKRAGFEVQSRRVENGDEMREALVREVWDIILSDFNLPRFSADEALGILKESGLDLPFILVSGALTTPDAIRLMKRGAHDFARKDDLELLVPAVERELKDAENRRRQQEAEEDLSKLAAAVQQAGDMILITDPNGAIQYANPAFERVTGYARRELLGQNPSFLRSEAHDDLFFTKMWEGLSDGKPWIGQLVKKRRDGSLFQVHATISPIRDKAEEVTNFVAVYRDISKELQLEKQLRQSQKLEAIGTLAGGIAHDFNNILGAIIGYSELTMRKLPEESRARSNLEEILKAGLRARDLIAQLLTFSRQSDHQFKPLALRHLVKEGLEFMRATLPATVRIESHMAGDQIVVLADPTKIHQLVMNLCTNAAQAMRETGGGVLEVGLEAKRLQADEAQALGLESGPHARLWVRDTGVGMPPEVKSRMFDPFYTTKDVGQGTGLGLSVVHGIVTDHHGSITVDSAEGEGTTVLVHLPMLTISGEVEGLPNGAQPPEGRGRVLFVDDEEALVGIARETLEKLGYDVETASNGKSALALFEAAPSRIDMVITDQTMPNMTGVELMQKIKAIRQEIPVVLCSGHSDTVSPDKAETMGFVTFLQKPVLARDLGQVVHRFLGRGLTVNPGDAAEDGD